MTLETLPRWAAELVRDERVARSLHARWRLLPPPDRERLERFARDAKEKALDLRGSGDQEAAGEDLREANETLAAALVENAESDPDVADEDVELLREELRRELERLATADIKASRSRREHTPPPG